GDPRPTRGRVLLLVGWERRRNVRVTMHLIRWVGARAYHPGDTEGGARGPGRAQIERVGRESTERTPQPACRFRSAGRNRGRLRPTPNVFPRGTEVWPVVLPAVGALTPGANPCAQPEGFAGRHPADCRTGTWRILGQAPEDPAPRPGVGLAVSGDVRAG